MSVFFFFLGFLHNIHPGLMDKLELASEKIDKFKKNPVFQKVTETVSGFREKIISNATMLKPFLPKPLPLPVEEVATDNEITDGEEAVLLKRLPKIQKALTNLIGDVEVNDIPMIGLVGSGGGYRAMIAMLGFTWALEKLGVLDAVSHISALSGSTWMLNSWLAQGYTLAQMNTFLKKQVKDTLSVKFQRAEIDVIRMVGNILQKVAYKQPVSLVDFSGLVLGSILLKGLPGNGIEVYMSDLVDKIADGSYPYPISTAVLEHTRPFAWVEFSPYEVGTPGFSYWVPPDYFGQRFDSGKSLDRENGPRQTLGYMMGIFGSAYAVSIGEVLREVIQTFEAKISAKLKEFGLDTALGATLVQQLGIFQELSIAKGSKRFSPPKIHNFMRGMQYGDAFGEAVTVFDAGLDFNLPFPPLLRRGIGVYLVCDASDYPNINYHALKSVQAFAQRKNYKFPDINYDDIDTRAVSLFYDENDPEVPVVIYFPNMVKFSTFKFDYSSSEFDSLHDTMYRQVFNAKNEILKGIKIGIENTQKLVGAKISTRSISESKVTPDVEDQKQKLADLEIQSADAPVVDPSVVEAVAIPPSQATLNQNILQLDVFAQNAGNSLEAQKLREIVKAMKILQGIENSSDSDAAYKK